MTLFLLSLGVSLPSPGWENVVQSYVRAVSETRSAKLVAVYTAQLPVPLQVPTFASFLVTVQHSDDRAECLSLAASHGLDHRAIATAVAEAPELASSDAKVDALEFLWFDPAQRCEALRVSNRLLKGLIAEGRIAAAADLLDSEPSDLVDAVRAGWAEGIAPPEEEALLVAEHADLAECVECHQPGTPTDRLVSLVTSRRFADPEFAAKALPPVVFLALGRGDAAAARRLIVALAADAASVAAAFPAEEIRKILALAANTIL